MTLLGQEGGTIDLEPIFYGNESMGPHLQVVTGRMKDDKFVVDSVDSRAKLRLKADGKIELKGQK